MVEEPATQLAALPPNLDLPLARRWIDESFRGGPNRRELRNPPPYVPHRPPLTILVQGGIASGKSTISRLLESRGALRLDCDKIAHDVLNSAPVRAQVAEAWGAELVQGEEVDRRALGERVFADEAALEQLEAWIHPEVAERVQAALTERARPADQPREVVVVDAAVAEKMKLTKGDYDLRLFVKVSSEARNARARERGWDEGEVERREARQEPLQAREARAHFVLPNEGALAEAENHVQRFWDDFVEPRR